MDQLEEARLFAVNLFDLYQCEGLEHYLGHYDTEAMEEMIREAAGGREGDDSDSDDEEDAKPSKKAKKGSGKAAPDGEAGADGKKEECK